MAQGLTGIFTEIDTDVLVQRTLQLNRRPLAALQNRRAQYQKRQSAVGEIESALTTLRTHLDSMRDPDNLRAVSASVSNTDVLGVSAGSGAYEGTHQIEVGALAASEREVHAGLTPRETWTHVRTVSGGDEEFLSAAEITAGSADQFVFRFGGEAEVTVDLSAYDETGMTLDELVSEINTAAGYTAATAMDDSGTFRLVLQAQAVGDGTAFSVSEGSTIAALDATDDFTQKVDASTATGALVGEGEFAYSYNGQTRTFVTGPWTSLGELVDRINDDLANPGVQASVLEYEVDSEHRYHLVLSGKDSGSDYAIDVTTMPAALAAGGAFEQTQTASDARIKVDGYPSGAGEWITRSSNSVSDVIPGLTLTLKQVGETTVSLSRSTGKLANDVDSLVNIYNMLVDRVKGLTSYDREAGSAGILRGDSAVNSILTRLRATIVAVAPGFDTDQTELTRAWQLGLEFEGGLTGSGESASIDRDKLGRLRFDTDRFEEALTDNYQGVLALLGADRAGGSDSPYLQFRSASGATEPGAYEVEADFNPDTGAITSARIRGEGETVWRNVTVEDGVIYGDSGTPENGLEIVVNWDGGSETLAATVRVRQGLAGALYEQVDAMLDSRTGLLNVRQEQYDATIKAIDRNIETVEARLERKEKSLRAHYARMEAAMAQLDSQRGAFEAMLASLESFRKNK